MPVPKYHAYIVKVSDPEKPEIPQAVYPHVRAVSERHADVQGRDGFCGLLGVDQAQRDRLIVEVSQIPE